jgi:hypothetical protein
MKLSKIDEDHFAKLEKVIESGKKTFVAVGLALEEIRQERLYRIKYSTFEEYCQKRWGWNAHRGRQLINSALVVELLPKEMGNLLPNSAAASELGKVKPEERVAVVEKAAARGPVTAKSITAAAKAVAPPTSVVRRDAIGREIPYAILADWDRAHEVGTRLRSTVSKLKCELQAGLESKTESDKDIIFRELTNSIISDASALHYSLGQILPYAVCPKCQGKTHRDCLTCRQRGFVSKSYWEGPNVTKDLRNFIQKQYANSATLSM